VTVHWPLANFQFLFASTWPTKAGKRAATAKHAPSKHPRVDAPTAEDADPSEDEEEEEDVDDSSQKEDPVDGKDGFVLHGDVDDEEEDEDADDEDDDEAKMPASRKTQDEEDGSEDDEEEEMVQQGSSSGESESGSSESESSEDEAPVQPSKHTLSASAKARLNPKQFVQPSGFRGKSLDKLKHQRLGGKVATPPTGKMVTRVHQQDEETSALGGGDSLMPESFATGPSVGPSATVDPICQRMVDPTITMFGCEVAVRACAFASQFPS